MALPKPTFGRLFTNYPTENTDFGRGGTIVDNGYYQHTCALRMSVALTRCNKDIMNEYQGTTARDTRTGTRFPYARGALALAQYLRGRYVGWVPQRLGSLREALALREQGIIFWKNKGTVDHIDLFDGRFRILPAGRNRSMLWIPISTPGRPITVLYAWFWRLN